MLCTTAINTPNTIRTQTGADALVRETCKRLTRRLRAVYTCSMPRRKIGCVQRLRQHSNGITVILEMPEFPFSRTTLC